MFGRHLRLPVDVSLGVAPTQLSQNAVTWVTEHHKKLKSAYDLAHRKMGVTASREKGHYDQKVHAPLLLPGERVWVRDRNREGHGKLHSWWDPEQHVVVEIVGNSGFIRADQRKEEEKRSSIGIPSNFVLVLQRRRLKRILLMKERTMSQHQSCTSHKLSGHQLSQL